MILFNGASGGIGRYMEAALSNLGLNSHALRARLEDEPGLDAELQSLPEVPALTFIHLAAMVSVPACEADPVAAYETNVVLASSTLSRVLDWTVTRDIRARVIYASTGHVYEAPARGVRVNEEARTAPRSVYARTKLEAEYAFAEMTEARQVPLLITRVFGLIGPDQAVHYVLPGLIARVIEKRVDLIPGLDFTRDYLDARDVCSDLTLLSVAPWKDRANVINVCSGVGVTIRDLLREAAKAIDPDGAHELTSRATAAPGRADDVDYLVGSPKRFVEWTGSNPRRISLERSVSDAAARAVSEES